MICVRVGTLEAGVRTLESVFKTVVDRWTRPGVTPGSASRILGAPTPGSTLVSTPNQLEKTLVFHEGRDKF